MRRIRRLLYLAVSLTMLPVLAACTGSPGETVSWNAASPSRPDATHPAESDGTSPTNPAGQSGTSASASMDTGGMKGPSSLGGSSSITGGAPGHGQTQTPGNGSDTHTTSGGGGPSSRPAGTTTSGLDSSPRPSYTTQMPKNAVIFRVEDYGAKGDGKTDDGPAVSRTVEAAMNSTAADKVVLFQSGRTYRLASAPKENSFNRVFSLIGGKNIHILGENTRLLMKAPSRVAYFKQCQNIEFSGFIIDYSPKPFVLGRVTAIGPGNRYIDFQTSEDLGFTGTVNPPAPYYAFRNRREERLHYFISSMENRGSGRYRLYMTDADRVAKAVVGEEFILPVYQHSHSIGSLFSISETTNFDMKNVYIEAVPEFAFDIRSNAGYTRFTNVRLEPTPGSPIHLVSWRDGFHVKDNVSKPVWDNCYIGPLGDDAFNLSAVICNVQSYDETTGKVVMKPAEAEPYRNGLKAGDELAAYNMSTGEDFGVAKIAEVYPSGTSVQIRLDRKMPGLKPGCQIAFYTMNKDFVIKNSYMEGTLRVRCPGTFENCRLNVFWVRVENETYVEGPVPKDILFKNCTFTTPYAADKEIFHVGTQIGSGFSAAPQYKCRNIVLQSCRFLKGKAAADPGNELIIK